ncbi:MAG: hypothetical protein D6734_12000 [Candidatus Schekmanbacteria bacterium]|nr:MAG: hypothetical protein D6734_12000 [Candidatus Schekmanbacteria bacterium]
MSKEKNIKKEKVKDCIKNLNEMFLPYLKDEDKNPQIGGVEERWIYELSSGEEIVVEAAVKLLEKSDSKSFWRIVDIMCQLRLIMCNEILNQLLSKEKLDEVKRVICADFLIRVWGLEFEKLPEKIKSIIRFKKEILKFNNSSESHDRELLKELIHGLTDKELYSGLLLAAKEVKADELITSIEPLIGISDKFELVLIKLLPEISPESSISLFEKIYAENENKKIRKEINKAVYKFKKSGFAVDEEKFKEEKRNPMLSGRVETGGYVSAMMDGGNIQLIVFYIHHTVKGYHLFTALRSMKEGLVDFSATKVSKKGIKKYIDYIRNERRTPVFQVSAEHCRYLLDESVKIRKSKGKDLNRQYERWKDFIVEHIECPCKAEIYKYFDENDIDKNCIDSIVGQMNPQEILALYLIEDEDIVSLYKKYNEIEKSGIILNETLKKEVSEERIKNLVEEFFTDERRQIIVRKLEELSLLLFLMGQKDESKKFLTLAIDAASVSKSSESLFLKRLMEESLESYRLEYEARKKEEEGPSLIVNPYNDKR